MKITKILIFTFLTVCFCHSWSQTKESPTDYWFKILSDNPPEKVLQILQQSNSIPWPKIPSNYAVSKMEVDEKEEGLKKIDLIKLLHQKIKDFYNEQTAPGSGLSHKKIKELIALSSQLEQAGGFGNLVLANTCQRLVWFELCRMLVNDTSKTNEVSQLIQESNIGITDFKKMMIELADQDPFLEKKQTELKNVNSTNLIAAVMDLGFPLADAAFKAAESKETSKLLEQSSVLGLLSKKAVTERFYLINLKGSIEYLKRNGDKNRLFSDNAKPFYALITKEVEWNHKYPPLGIRSLSRNDCRYVFLVQQDETQRKLYLKQTLD